MPGSFHLVSCFRGSSRLGEHERGKMEPDRNSYISEVGRTLKGLSPSLPSTVYHPALAVVGSLLGCSPGGAHSIPSLPLSAIVLPGCELWAVSCQGGTSRGFRAWRICVHGLALPFSTWATLGMLFNLFESWFFWTAKWEIKMIVVPSFLTRWKFAVSIVLGM